ncbi:MAG: hypothetical protein KC546_00595 [Anaerolineae bacterium]|nr:hypothetical protein [Anaerolineae bacterium]
MDHRDLSEQERVAVRAYLGRAEVRLSTLHRIATAFISGAGLLLLIPIFLRDVVDDLLLVFIGLIDHLPSASDALDILLFLLVLYPFILSLSVPIYGVYLMLKDTLQFYFTLYAPGMPTSILNPTFALNALMLSPDEAPTAKAAAQQLQYEQRYVDYMLSFSDKRRAKYFDQLVDYTNREIIPPTRRDIANAATSPTDVDRVNAALGITRGLDRSLIEEVALVELTLARNILYLRRLVMRYVKTLLMFIWTAIISFIALPFLQSGHFPPLTLLAICYLAWSVIALMLLRMPLNWISRHRQGDINPDHVDAQITLLESQVIPLLRFAIGGCVLALAIQMLPTG